MEVRRSSEELFHYLHYPLSLPITLWIMRTTRCVMDTICQDKPLKLSMWSFMCAESLWNPMSRKNRLQCSNDTRWHCSSQLHYLRIFEEIVYYLHILSPLLCNSSDSTTCQTHTAHCLIISELTEKTWPPH